MLDLTLLKSFLLMLWKVLFMLALTHSPQTFQMTIMVRAFPLPSCTLFEQMRSKENETISLTALIESLSTVFRVGFSFTNLPFLTLLSLGGREKA